MAAPDRQALLPGVLEIARDAGAVIRSLYRQNVTVSRKPDQSLLTTADQAAHDLIAERLARLTPGIPVLSEEAHPPRWEQRRLWDRYWLVDPLDGTRQFVRRNDQFSVNIALVEQHRPVLGVIHAPTRRLQWFGGPGLGGWRQLEGRAPVAIQPRRPAGESLRVVLGGTSPGPRTRRLLARLPRHEVLTMGASIKFCMVAEGDADVFPRYGPISEWDLAAAQALLEAVGGHLLHMGTLQPVRYNRRASTTLEDVLAIGTDELDWGGLLADLG